MGYLDRILKIIGPCPIPPDDSSSPYREPISRKINRWTRIQILAFSISIITMTSILFLNQSILFYTPVQTRVSNKYNINAQIIRINENRDSMWEYTLRLANSTSQPNQNVGFISIVECKNGDIALAAPFLNRADGTPYWGLILVRLNENGNVLWKQTYDEINLEIGLSLVEVNSNGFAIAGTTRYFDAELNQLNRDVFLIRTDSQGDIIWNEIYEEHDNDWASSLICCNSDGFIITGRRDYCAEVCDDVFLHRIDDYGQTIWKHCYGGLSHDFGWSVVECRDGSFTVSATTEGNDLNHSDVLLFHTDEYGTELWNQSYYGIEHDNGWSLIELKQGGFVITGSSTKIDYDGYHSLTEGLFIQTSQNGTLLTKKALYYNPRRTYVGWNCRCNCWGYMISESNNEGYFIVGTVSDREYKKWDMMLLEIDANGKILWNASYGGQSLAYGYSLAKCNNEGYAIAGVKVTPV